MRAVYACILLLCAACGHRAEEDFYSDVERPERVAADPSIVLDPGLKPPPTRPPAQPVGHATVSDARLFAEATPGIYEMALDETHLYWVTDGSFGPSEVWRANRDSAEAELLVTSTERVYALAIDEDHVYFVETPENAALPASGSVLRVLKTGGDAQTLVGDVDNPTSLAVDDTHVYFPKAYSPDGNVQRAPKTGGSAEIVVADVDNPWDFAVDATHLYISEMNRARVIRTPKGGGDVEELATGEIATGWLALGPAGAFFQTPDDLRSVPLAGGDITVLHESPLQTGKIAYGRDYVLWGDWFVPLDASAPTRLLASFDVGNGVTGVAADEHALFVADHPSGRIFTATVTVTPAPSSD